MTICGCFKSKIVHTIIAMFLVIKILANKFFQTVLLNRKKNMVMETIFQLKLPSKFSIQFNINLKIDKTKTLIVKKNLV